MNGTLSHTTTGSWAELTESLQSCAIGAVNHDVSAASILIVDDSPASRRLFERILTARGHTVRTAEDGERALASIDQNPPDLVILDVCMPGIDGFQVCRSVKRNQTTRFIPVVLVTGLNDQASRIEGINAGADEFLAKPVDRTELEARVQSLLHLKRSIDELESAESVILSLALTVEARDPYTGGHCQRLARYAVELGRCLGLSNADLAALYRGGFLHDVGKIGISDSLLLKPAKLTAAEYEAIKQHTLIGDQLCGNMRSLASVRPIVRQHHERLDGSGYPDGLQGDKISLLAQIVGVVDAYDAITTHRPYQEAQSPQYALIRLQERADEGLFHPELVKAFTSLQPAALLSMDDGTSPLRPTLAERGHRAERSLPEPPQSS
jgi:putative two-component system response regulator